MKHTAHPRLMVLLPVLLALILSSAACALPFTGSQVTPTAVLAVPTQIIPTLTLAPTQDAPALPPPTQASANTQPAAITQPAAKHSQLQPRRRPTPSHRRRPQLPARLAA